MLNLQQIESDLKDAIKAKNQIAADTLRGLKTRIQNEQIAKMSRGAGAIAGGKDLSEEEIILLVRSEVKRRKEAAESFKTGGRAEMADKELREAGILEKYLPAQMTQDQLFALLDNVIAEGGFTAEDFGKAMAMAKAKAGSAAEGAVIAKLLKEKLK